MSHSGAADEQELMAHQGFDFRRLCVDDLEYGDFNKLAGYLAGDCGYGLGLLLLAYLLTYFCQKPYWRTK